MKISQSSIRALEKRYAKAQKDTLLSKSILNKINKEKAILGKERLSRDKLKLALGQLPRAEAKNQAIVYLLNLLNFNFQVYSSVKKERDKDQKALKARVNKAFKDKKAAKEVHSRLMDTADFHFDLTKHHVNHIKKGSKKIEHHKGYQVHKAKAERIYKLLAKKNVKTLLKKLAIRKLDQTYAEILRHCEHLDKQCKETLTLLEKGKNLKTKMKSKLNAINLHLDTQYEELRFFALVYSKSLIHAAEYVDHNNEKIVLYTHI